MKKMESQNNHAPPDGYNKPLDRLKAASDALNQYVIKRERGKKSPFRAFVSYILSKLSKDYRENENNKLLLEHKKIRELSDEIRVHSASFPILEQGSPEQSKLAADVKEAVEKFNQKKGQEISIFNKSMEDKKNLVASPILLHHRLTCQKMVVGSADFNQLFVSTFRNPNSHDYKPTQNDIDSFKMKAKKLMEKEGLLPEVIQEILKSPICYKIGEWVKEEKKQPLIEFHLRFARLGDEVEIKGAFLRETQHQSMYSIPIPESFRLTYTSTQSGSPSPELHTGVGFPDWFIPTSPLRMECLKDLFSLYEQKNQLAQDLFNQIVVKKKANTLFKKKKLEFQNNKEAYISAQHTLCALMIAKAPKEALLPETEKTIEDFFASLSSSICAYELLGDCYHSIIELFLDGPYHKIQKAWITGSHPTLVDSVPEVRLNAIKSLYKVQIEEALQITYQKYTEAQSQHEKNMWSFIRCMGYLLGVASESLLLLEQSEKCRFKPPMLTDYESMLLSFAFKQMIEFFEEMKNHSSISLIEQIQSDIEIFKENGGAYEEYADVIESYFHARYHAGYI